MDRIKYLEAKIKLIEDAIKEGYPQNKAISEAGHYESKAGMPIPLGVRVCQRIRSSLEIISSSNS